MENSNIQWNGEGLSRIAELQKRLTLQVQNTAKEVNEMMAGQPAEGILAELHSRVRKLNIKPDDEGLRRVANAISDRSFSQTTPRNNLALPDHNMVDGQLSRVAFIKHELRGQEPGFGYSPPRS